MVTSATLAFGNGVVELSVGHWSDYVTVSHACLCARRLESSLKFRGREGFLR